MAIFWHVWQKSAKMKIFIKNRAVLFFLPLLPPNFMPSFRKIVGAVSEINSLHTSEHTSTQGWSHRTDRFRWFNIISPQTDRWYQDHSILFLNPSPAKFTNLSIYSLLYLFISNFGLGILLFTHSKCPTFLHVPSVLLSIFLHVPRKCPSSYCPTFYRLQLTSVQLSYFLHVPTSRLSFFLHFPIRKCSTVLLSTGCTS